MIPFSYFSLFNYKFIKEANQKDELVIKYDKHIIGCFPMMTEITIKVGA